MSTYGSIKEDVKAYLGDDIEGFDVDGIVSDIRAAGITDVDDMDEDDFQTIVTAHDESGRPSSLAVLRTDAGMTQKELADAVGVGQGRVSEWESGAREMSATACLKIARALGVDPGMIVEAVATRRGSSHEAGERPRGEALRSARRATRGRARRSRQGGVGLPMRLRQGDHHDHLPAHARAQEVLRMPKDRRPWVGCTVWPMVPLPLRLL